MKKLILLCLALSFSATAQDENYDDRIQDELQYLEEVSDSTDYYLPEREEVSEVNNPQIMELEEQFMNDEVSTSAAATEEASFLPSDDIERDIMEEEPYFE